MNLRYETPLRRKLPHCNSVFRRQKRNVVTTELRRSFSCCVCSEEECQKAFADFNGRWYAGRQLSCEFSSVTNWKSAICGKFIT